MIITIYTFFMAIICFSVFIAVYNGLRGSFDIYIGFNLYPLLFLVALTLVRLFAPVEFSWTREVNVDVILPVIQGFLQSDIMPNILPVSRFVVIAVVLLSVSMCLIVAYIKSTLAVLRERQAMPPTENGRLIRLMDEVVSESKVKGQFTIVTVPEVKSPAICGLSVPILMFPEACLSLSDKDIKAIFRHEWQHYMNKDMWVTVIIDVLCFVMWWNPLIYAFKRNLKETLEVKCDLDVVRNMSRDERYEYVTSIYDLHYFLNEEVFGELDSDDVVIPFTGTAARDGRGVNVLSNRLNIVFPFKKRNHRKGIICCGIFLTLFVLSYGFVIQPFVHMPRYDYSVVFDEVCEDDIVVYGGFPYENFHIVLSEDGTYSLYFRGEFVRHIENEADLKWVFQIFGDIPIVFYRYDQ